MLKKILVLIFLFQLFVVDTRPLYPFGSSEKIPLNVLIEEALKNNPEILAAKKRWEASNARVPQAKSLENPVVGLTFEKTPGSPFQLGKTASEDRMLSISQFLPSFGKLSLKGKIALVESQMFAAEYKNKELEVVNQVKNTYYSLFMNQKEVELKKESLELLKSIARIAEAKYSVSEITQEEVYKIHLEIASLNNDIVNLEEDGLAKQTRLNTLLNRDPEASLGRPVLGEEINFQEDSKSLYQAVILNQPELIVFAYAVEKNKYAKSLAKKSFFPDLIAGIVQRGITTGTIGPWDLMLSFSVPFWFWTKQRYEVKEAIANLEEAEAAYKAMQNKAFNEVKNLVAKIEIAKNKIRLYKSSLIPILESSIKASLAGFRSGGSDFMILLDSQRMLIETRMNYYKAQVEYNMNLADLERVVGKDLALEANHAGEEQK